MGFIHLCILQNSMSWMGELLLTVQSSVLDNVALIVHGVSMDSRDSAYATYDSEIVRLLFHVLESNYNLHVNSSTIGLMDEAVGVIGPGSISAAKHPSFPILIHRPTLYHKVNIIKRSKVIFLAPFANDVWVVLALVLVALTVAMTYILAREVRLSDYETGNLNGNRSQVRWELSEMLLVSIGALCQQGTTLNPQAPSSRTLFLAIFIMAAHVYTAFNASIISITESYVTSGTVISSPALFTSGRPHFVINERDEKELKRLCGDSKIEMKTIAPAEVLGGVLEGSAILLADQTSTRDTFHRRSRSMKKLCKVKETSFTGETFYRIFSLQHDKYKRLIDHSLLRFREFGLFDRTRKFLFKTWPLCEAHGACCSEAVSIHLDDVFPAFYLLGAGVGLSLILLSMELSYFQCSKFFRRKRKSMKKISSSQDKWSRLKDTLLCMGTENRKGSIGKMETGNEYPNYTE